MFINCPFCESLVATDPATDLPPERCPRCAERLRDLPMDTAAAPLPAPFATGDEPATPVFDLLEVPTPEALAAAAPPVLPASGLAAQIHQAVAPATAAEPIAPIATLLRPRPPQASEPEPKPEPDTRARTEPTPAPRKEAPPAPEPVATAELAATPPTPADINAMPAAAGAPDAAETAIRPTEDADAVDTAGAAATEATADEDGDHGDDASMEASPTLAPTGPVAAASPGPTPAKPTAATSTARALPSFVRRRHGRASGFDWRSGAAIAGLALLLVLQLLLADRAHLASQARWRPLLANVCGVLGCSLPPWREPGAFRILARDVRPHPSTPGALRVTATFRNDARWPQSWPRVRLTLSDVNGNAVAARDFDARDYLGAAPEQAELRSGQSASIVMDVQEPATRSVAFDFELH